MANQVLWRSFALFFIIFDFFGADAATITVQNNCPSTIWPAIISTGQSQVSTTGFKLPSGASRSFNVPTPWTGRVWARTRCSTNSGTFTCLTGDCGSGEVACRGAGGVPPVTLAEFALASNGGQDFYDLSLVDGFNVPASITAQGGTGPCKSPNCLENVNAACPIQFQVKTPSGEVIGCRSACQTYKQPQYCCTGEFSDPRKCKEIFVGLCPDAYNLPYDDANATFTCNNQPNYVITYCKDPKFSICKGPTHLDISKVKIL